MTNELRISDKLAGQIGPLQRQGAKMFIHRPDVPDEYGASACPNCNGCGSLGLQWFVGGPYETAPNCSNEAVPAGSQNVAARATFYNGKWYRQMTKTDTCPVCNGSGQPGAAVARQVDIDEYADLNF